MSRPKVVVNAHAHSLAETKRTIQSVANKKYPLRCLDADKETIAALQPLGCEPIEGETRLDGRADVVIVSPPAVFDLGALRDLQRESRQVFLIRVLIAGDDRCGSIAYWNKEFLKRNPVDLRTLAQAGLDFDAAHLPKDVSWARRWIRGSDIGIENNQHSGAFLFFWTYYSAGKRFVSKIVARMRRRAGVAKRALAAKRDRYLANHLSHR